MTKDPNQKFSVGHVSMLVKKLVELSSQEEYRIHLELDTELKSDIDNIILSDPDSEDRCDIDYLRFRVRYESELYPEFVNFYPFVYFANEWIFGSCLSVIDSRFMRFYKRLRRPTKDRISSIYERGKLNKVPRYRVITESLNGHNSDSPSTNLQARMMIMSAALELYEGVLRNGIPHPIGTADHFFEFKNHYNNLIYRPCMEIYEETGVSMDEVELLTVIRLRYNLSAFPEIERLHSFCLYLGFNMDEADKVYHYYVRHIEKRSRGRIFPNRVQNSFLGETDFWLTSTEHSATHELSRVFEEDGISLKLLSDPREQRDELKEFETHFITHLPDLPYELRELVDFKRVSRERCLSVEPIEQYNNALSTRIIEIRPFLNEYANQQIQLCEGLIWAELGPFLRNLSFENKLNFELLRGLIQHQQFVNDQPLWPAAFSRERLQAWVDLFYLHNHPMPEGVTKQQLFHPWREQVCSSLQNLTDEQLQRWAVIELYDKWAAYRSSQITRPSRMVMNMVGYVTLCRRSDNLFVSPTFPGELELFYQSSQDRTKESYQMTRSRIMD